MKKEIFTCDIKGCDSEASKKQQLLQVIFETEQTEGRSSPPYLVDQSIDICKKHFDHLLTGHCLFASGAMGHNEYYFK